MTVMTQCQSSSATLVEALQSDNENLQLENAELKAKLTWYEEQFRLYKHKQFGSASERHEGQGNLFNEAEAVEDESTPDDEPETQTVPGHTRKKTSQKIPERQHHLEVSRATMADWMIRSSARLEPLLAGREQSGSG